MVSWRATATTIIAHPHPAFGGRLDTPLVLALAAALEQRDVSTIRFNFRGIGSSDGTATGGIAEADDVRAVAAWTRAQRPGPLALVGYSFGALMALKAISDGEPCDAVAAVALPTQIVGDHADRIADITRALHKGIPTLFVQGDRDPFCELPRLTAWTQNLPHITVETTAGEGHFFRGTEEQASSRVAAFIADLLQR
jgi:uncharacterized protein